MSERKLRVQNTWTYECSCFAPAEMFLKWEDIPQAVRDLIPDNGLPCDGGGRPGPWCRDCGFGRVEEFDERGRAEGGDVNAEDMLEKWADEMAFAESADFPAEPDHRTTVGDAKYMAIRGLAAALRAEQERVAELEADAKLGRMVREMPEGVSLHHNCNGYDEWSCEYGKTWTWEPTPEAALEAARKEEP